MSLTSVHPTQKTMNANVAVVLKEFLPEEGDDNRLFPLYSFFILVGKDTILSELLLRFLR